MSSEQQLSIKNLFEKIEFRQVPVTVSNTQKFDLSFLYAILQTNVQEIFTFYNAKMKKYQDISFEILIVKDGFLGRYRSFFQSNILKIIFKMGNKYLRKVFKKGRP